MGRCPNCGTNTATFTVAMIEVGDIEDELRETLIKRTTLTPTEVDYRMSITPCVIATGLSYDRAASLRNALLRDYADVEMFAELSSNDGLREPLHGNDPHGTLKAMCTVCRRGNTDG